MVEWHHQLNGHEFEQILGDSKGQGSLACCGSWGHRVGHNLVTEQHRLLFLRVPNGGGKGATVSDDLMVVLCF